MTCRSEYWNEEYFQYWKSRVDESNKEEEISKIVKGDFLSSKNSDVESAIRRLILEPSSTVLEIGCGFGRSLKLLSDSCKKVYAADISKQMIAVAKENNKLLKNIFYYVSEAESLGFKANTFDYIFCFAVFDALKQEVALKEFNRMLKLGGRLLITGKNSKFMTDDIHAIEAEISARKKKHPNYFTDVHKFLSHLNDFGFSMISQRYFLYRGDGSKVKYLCELPERFYEYEFIIEKISYVDFKLNFSNEYSENFLRKEAK